jgi:putative flippase GtrA
MMRVDDGIETAPALVSSRGALPGWVRELFGYGLASGVALLADTAILTTLVKLAHWPYLVAASLAFGTGAIVAYLLSITFVFRYRQVEGRALEFGSFVGLGLVGLGVNAAVLFVAVNGAGVELIPAKVLAAGATFTTNFTLRRQMLFQRRGTAP